MAKAREASAERFASNALPMIRAGAVRVCGCQCDLIAPASLALSSILSVRSPVWSAFYSDPFAPDRKERGHCHWAEEKSDQSKRLQTANNSDQYQQER
jgi:hypothetical protein